MAPTSDLRGISAAGISKLVLSSHLCTKKPILQQEKIVDVIKKLSELLLEDLSEKVSIESLKSLVILSEFHFIYIQDITLPLLFSSLSYNSNSTSISIQNEKEDKFEHILRSLSTLSFISKLFTPIFSQLSKMLRESMEGTSKNKQISNFISYFQKKIRATKRFQEDESSFAKYEGNDRTK